MSSKLDTVLLNGCATYSGDQSTVTTNPSLEQQSLTLNTEDKEINLHTELSFTFSKNKFD